MNRYRAGGLAAEVAPTVGAAAGAAPSTKDVRRSDLAASLLAEASPHVCEQALFVSSGNDATEFFLEAPATLPEEPASVPEANLHHDPGSAGPWEPRRTASRRKS